MKWYIHTYMQGARRDGFRWQISPSCPCKCLPMISYRNVCLLSTWRRSFHRTSLSVLGAERRQKKGGGKRYHYIYKKRLKGKLLCEWSPYEIHLNCGGSWLDVLNCNKSINQHLPNDLPGPEGEEVKKIARYFPCTMNHLRLLHHGSVATYVGSYLLCTICIMGIFHIKVSDVDQEK